MTVTRLLTRAISQPVAVQPPIEGSGPASVLGKPVSSSTGLRAATLAGLVVCLLATAAGLVGASSAAAAGPPIRHLDTLADTTAAAGSPVDFLVTLTNQSSTNAVGQSAIGITLPAGLTAASAQGMSCDDGAGGPLAGASTVRCFTSGPGHFQVRSVRLTVNVDPGASGDKTAHLEAYGGGATRLDGTPCATLATPPPALPPCATSAATIHIQPSPRPFGIDAFDGQVNADPIGTPYSQAAGTPYSASTSFDINTLENQQLDQGTAPGAGIGYPTEAIRDALVQLPPGLIGNPTGVSQCSADQLTVQFPRMPNCPPESQIGTVFVRTDFGTLSSGLAAPLYNMVPPPDVPARFGFNLLGVDVLLDAHLRSGSDYGLNVDARGISEGLAVAGTTLTIWGVPSDPSHDNERSCPGGATVGAIAGGCTTSAPQTSFLRLPSSCQGPLTTTLNADSWQTPGGFNPDGSAKLSDPAWHTQSFVSHNPPAYPNPPSEWGSQQGTTGCNQVPFNPQITVQPTSQAADSPTGLDVNLSLPQTNDPNSIGEADLKKAVVDLPAGMAVNPSAADGLGACRSAQVALNSDGPASCPDNAKVGTVQVTTPLLSAPLDGSVYLARQQDNPFNNLLSLYIVASGQGVNVKLPGKIEPDPATGQLRATFDNNPQLPFSNLALSFFSGSRATLTTPPTCGTKAVNASLSSWAQPNSSINRSDTFQITSGPNGSPCPSDAAHRPFAPQMSAGTVNPAAGQFSPFVLRLQRQPGEQELTSLEADLPPGLLGKLAGVAQCPDATLNSIPAAIATGQPEIDSPSCPANSLLGYAHIGAGSGAPFYVNTGKVYLAGPYKGAPLSIAILTPAVAGPFDLGNVVVRSGLNLDKDDAQIHFQSDPIPTILHGIPLDIRDIRVVIDRPNFTLNPTSCDPMSVGGTATGTEGATAQLSDRFQVGSCDRLRFKPRFNLQLRGGTHRADYESLRATVTYPKRGAYSNIAKAAVTLPHAAFLAQNHIRTICTRVQFAADACPAGSVYGHAEATSPILDYPLQGDVYLRSSDNPLPDLVAKLRGPESQPIEVDLAGRTDSVKGALRNTFDVVPDAPVEKFTLQLFGGKRALIELSTDDYCAHTHRAKVNLEAHDAAQRFLQPVLRNPKCGKKRSAHKSKRAHR